MPQALDRQELTSRLIKILRISIEPLSAHAISDMYNFSYSRVKRILQELEEEKIIASLKAKIGTFYFIPNKYFKRNIALGNSEELMPSFWLEEFSTQELIVRKNKLLEKIGKIREQFDQKKIDGISYFKKLQEKNEEIGIINQIIEERKEAKKMRCFYCEHELKEENRLCPSCQKEVPRCIVCNKKIVGGQKVLLCPHCEGKAHKNHLLEWQKSFGFCPQCKKELRVMDLDYWEE
ncbi:MAG: hypothetical protein GF308_03455 [Candidatus Heimdallarchaeota archaeon]|nr:hypothetical protein [Candidatus Heimdallarchaeota archaeon]